MPYAKTPKGTLFYTRSLGPAAGPVVVLLHGAGGTHLYWPPQMRRLPGASVYALDLPGHGRSRGTGCDSVMDYAEAVAAFLQTVGAGQTVLAGHSMGGAIALKLALDLPHQVAGLVLFSSGARLRVAPAILEGLRNDFEQAVEVMTRFAWSSEAPPRMVALGRAALREAGPEVLLGDFSACDRFDVMDRLEKIQQPTLIVVGSADQLTPVKYANFLAERIPDAHLAIIEGGGHMVTLEQPVEVAKAVEGFLGLAPQN